MRRKFGHIYTLIQSEFKHTPLERTTESEDESDIHGNSADTTEKDTESKVDCTDESEVSDDESEAVDNTWEEESEDGHEINHNVLIEDTETEQPDYLDYSYTEIVARTKTTG